MPSLAEQVEQYEKIRITSDILYTRYVGTCWYHSSYPAWEERLNEYVLRVCVKKDTEALRKLFENGFAGCAVDIIVL